ncbi:Aldehyde/histidinol dehydrogenase [Suillus spraguei]|nr:Aldehyde/histidinol dehydrogenase [Suillus spraguei]
MSSYAASKLAKQPISSYHARHLSSYHQADESTVASAIDGALSAEAEWEAMPWNDRAAIFLRAAEPQPPKNSAGARNRVEYRALEGFVLAVSPFNFTAIGGNLPGVPALVGDTILAEAGIPAGVIQFVPGPPPEVVAQAISHPSFAALHFTGSTFIFKKLWKDIAANLDKYKGYPRIVGETGGKNFHVIHKSAEVRNAVFQTIRGGFEYQGLLLSEIAKIKAGSPLDFGSFIGPVMSVPLICIKLRTGYSIILQRSSGYDNITDFIQKAKDPGGKVLFGGTGDDSKGYFIQPTIILTKDANSIPIREEIFGPVITVMVFVQKRSLIFATDRKALLTATNKLRNAAGNIYYNEKCTGTVVGQQPFGGAQASGANDKAGSISIFYPFVSARSIKENFVGLEGFQYPSNLI